jgi:hypothetical protein
MLGSVRFGKLRAVLFLKHGPANTVSAALVPVFGASANDIVKVPTPVSSVLHHYGWSGRKDGDVVRSGGMLGVELASLLGVVGAVEVIPFIVFFISGRRNGETDDSNSASTPPAARGRRCSAETRAAASAAAATGAATAAWTTETARTPTASTATIAAAAAAAAEAPRQWRQLQQKEPKPPALAAHTIPQRQRQQQQD